MSSAQRCKSCGKVVAAGDKFCAGCGTVVALPDQTVVSGPGHDVGTNPTQCVKCGASMGRDDKFCPQCGAGRPEAATIVSHVSLRNAQAARLIEATQGEFEIVEQLGTGAMGAVYLAKDVALGRKVAIKVIAPHLLSDDTMISRFRLEAQTVASLRHPNIVNVHAVRQSDDLHFFIMEFIDGPPLRNIIKQNAPLEIDVVRAIMFQVGSALSYAHRSKGGVIHRDVKPANIMVDREGDAFVTDFGISKIAESQTGLTQTGATIGTPEYMSPEQCRGDALSGASDQYALGIVAYEMLVGHTPFTGTQYTIMVSHTSEPPRPLRELRPDCPADVAEAVERMLAKAPDARWPDLDSAVSAMGGAPLGYQDPVRHRIKALTGATVLHMPAVGASSRSGGASGGRATLDTATSVSVLGLPSVLETGERIQLRADVRGAGDTSLGGQGVVWASTDPSIAKVEGEWVEGVRPGSVSIMASAGNVASSVLLTVAEPAPAKVLVRPASVHMHSGGKIVLSAEVQDKRGRPLQREIRWRSSDPARATVTSSGEVLAKKPGEVTITAEAKGVSGSATVAVEAPVAAPPPAPAPSAAAAAAARPEPPKPKPAPPRPRAPERAAPAGRPVYRHPAVMAAALVALIAGGVVAVRSTGGDTAPPPGPATPAGSGVTPGPASPVGGGGTETSLPVSGGPGTQAPAPSSGPSPAGVASGQPAASGSGTSQPTATEPVQPTPSQPVASQPGATSRGAGAGRGQPGGGRGRGAGATEPATPPPTPVRVAVAVQSTTMQVNATQSATAQVFASGGTPMPGGSYTLSWQSRDPSVLSVSAQSGAVRAAAPGSSWLVAAAGSARDSVLIRVEASVSAVQIEQQDFSLEAGAPPRALTARVVDSGGQPVQQAVSWSSSNPAVASVDASGRVSPVATGTAQITAQTGSFQDRVTVTVTAAAPALPSPVQARAAVDGYVALLAARDRDAVTRLWGTANTGQRDEVLDLMGQNNFTATLGSVGAASQDGAAATVTFQVSAGWRTSFGQNRSRDLSFRARLERNGSEWRIASAATQ